MKPTSPLRPDALKFLTAIFSAAALTAAQNSAGAQTLWQNTNPVNGGTWSTPSNWSTNALPTASTEARIDNGGWARIESFNAVTRAFVVGSDTAGNRLSIQSGTLTTRAGTLGNNAGSSGSVTIGSNSIWKTDGSGAYSAFYVGLSGTGNLDIQSGGQLFTGDTTRIASGATSTGEATVRGLWQMTDGLSVGLNGIGRLTIGNGGTVTLLGGAMTLGSGANAQGTLTIGGTSTAEGAGRLNATSVSGGRMASLVFNHTDSRYRFASAADSIHGGAAILISGSTHVTHSAGTTIVDAANTYNGGTTISGGLLLANNIGNTSATGSGAVTVETSGTLGGTGRIGGAATVNGMLAPGDDAGILSFGSSLTLGSQSLTLIGVGGEERGTSYNAVNVTGTLTFNGTLRIALANDLELENGDTFHFTLFNAGAFSGTFGELDLPTLWNGNALLWESFALYTDGILSVTVVPEPGVLAFACLGAVAAWRLRRRDHSRIG